MSGFTISDLTNAVRTVIGSRRIELRDDMTARDVPAWDSLNNTLIAIELSERLGVEFTPKDLASTANMGELVALINRRTAPAA